jgi:hypothetical protein
MSKINPNSLTTNTSEKDCKDGFCYNYNDELLVISLKNMVFGGGDFRNMHLYHHF